MEYMINLGPPLHRGLKKLMDWLCYVPPTNISEFTWQNDGK